MREINYKGEFSGLKSLLREILPINLKELYILIFFFIIYSSYGLLVVIKTDLIDFSPLPIDSYFGYDTQQYIHHGYSYIAGHPFICIFTLPLIYIGIILNIIFVSLKAKTIFLTLVCTYLLASTFVYIYRYLKTVLNLTNRPIFVLLFFYMSFGMNFILSFTFESFILSAFILSFTVCFYSCNLATNKNVSFSSSLILALACGGITITNFVKGLIPILFIRSNFKTKLIKGFIISVIFILVVLCILTTQNSITGNYSYRINNFIYQENDTYKFLISYFIGTGILLPKIFQTHAFGGESDYLCINPDLYNNIWQYAFIIIVCILVVISIIVNRKKELIYIPISFLFFDILLHGIIKYGLNESYIYSAHWIFLIPILIGWLYNNESKIKRKTLNTILLILSIVLIINNTIELIQFYELAIELYPRINS